MHQEEDIIALAQQIQNADKQLKNTTCHKLGVIMEQVGPSPSLTLLRILILL